jgi:hypothetical protein
VTNWRRWQRTKWCAFWACIVAAIGLVGGLEGEGPIPHPWLALGALGCCLALVHSITANQHR